MKIAVVIPTVGRAQLAVKTVEHLSRQSRRPDRIVVVGSSNEDVIGLDSKLVFLAPKGLCSQRNRALRELAGLYDLVILFDDDYVPRTDFLEEAEQTFTQNPNIVGATGHIIGDGVKGVGYSFDEALALVAADDPAPRRHAPFSPKQALYGCNMVLRTSAIGGLNFDENLPHYGWLEDIDFTYQLGRRGQLVKCPQMAGVHMGIKMARSSGKRLGYSQIANPVYLMRKKTIPSKLARRLMAQQSLSNLARSFFPEPHVDRRGRLWGNMIAIKDLITGRIDPRRITEFR